MTKRTRPFHLIGAALVIVLAGACGFLRSPAEPGPDVVAETPAQTSEPADTPSPTREPLEPLLASQGNWSLANSGAESDWQVFLTGDGISGIALDGNFLWAASSGGLLRWDRESGRVVQYLAPAFPLPGNNLGQVLLHDGDLYISGRGGLTIFDRESQWTAYDEDDIGLEMGYHIPLAMADDTLWIAGEGGLARLSPDGDWERVDIDEEIVPGDRIDKIVPLDDELYVVVAPGPTVDDEQQVARFSDGAWEIVDRPALVFFETPDGNLWRGDRGTLLKSADRGETWEPVLEGLRYVQPRAYDDRGRLYASNEDTILVLEDDTVVETYRFTDFGPALNYINILQEDEDGRLWIATDGWGLSMFDGEEWHNWQPETSDIRDDAIRGMDIANGKVYAGTFGSAASGGVNILDIETEQWTNLWPDESPLSGGGVGGIAVDPQGNVYFPTAAGVLDIYDGENWQHVPMPDMGNYLLTTEDGLFDAEGDYWLATGGLGLWRYDGAEWIAYGIPGQIKALATDREGRLWISGEIGLVVRDTDERWYLYTSEELPFESSWFSDVAVDADGRVWIVTGSVLLAFNGEEYQVFAPEDAGAGNWGEALTFSRDGALWVEAGSGIARYRGSVEIPPFAGFHLRPRQRVRERDLIVDPADLIPAPPVDENGCVMESFCVDGLRVALEGTMPSTYTVEARVPGGEPITFVCPMVTTLIRSGDDEYVAECDTPGIFFTSFTPESIKITISWGDNSTSGSFQPKYEVVTPNGPDCPPKCRVGLVSIEIGDQGL